MNKEKGTFKVMVRLFKELKNQKFRLLLVLISILIYTFLNIYGPYYSVKVMDSLYSEIERFKTLGEPFKIVFDPLGKKLMMMGIIYFILGATYFFQSILMASVAEGLIYSLRCKISAKLNKLPLSFYDRNKEGEILSRITNDLDKVSETLQTGLLRFILAIGTIIGSLIMMFYYSYVLTLIFIGFNVISILITSYISKKNLKYATARQESVANLTGIMEEYYIGRNIIKAYNYESSSTDRVCAEVDMVAKINQKADFITNMVNPLIRFISRLAQATILLIGCKYAIDDILSFAIMQAYFQYMNISSEPIAQASFMINQMQSALASARRTFEYLDETEEVSDEGKDKSLENVSGNIEFNHVSFGYFPDKLLMQDISFKASSGEKIAIVGSTGAGKTTLVNLLMRFYEINGGDISIDGLSTKDMSRHTLRSYFGMVLQDTWLFHGSVIDNVKYGKMDATKEEVIEACKMAMADNFINLMPNGYETIIDNDASNISIGQRQLLTIARVFLCNPKMIILDEATSNVDTKTEIEITKAMNNLMSGRTSFIIAHRLSTIRNADLILYMEHGNILEFGNHETLLAKKGKYYSLYNSQFE